MLGGEQEPTHEPSELLVDDLPRSKMDRQHPPSIACSRQTAGRIQQLTQVNAQSTVRALRGGGVDNLPLLSGQTRMVATSLKGNLPCAMFPWSTFSPPGRQRCPSTSLSDFFKPLLTATRINISHFCEFTIFEA